MTASEIRQSFLDFFKEKQHTPVSSASLLPQSPGLLFTNAGMNQFVPFFLGTEKPPYEPPRATDTQKCIRAGGKHNDLDDVGYDTYHHTMFEMLGNWSFGDYFKEEAITWAWELIVERWGFPAERLYASVYRPNKEAGDPSEFDQEAYDLWAKCFEAKGLDPKVHVVDGDVKDNFWKMGDTGPCGPCSELHVDLTPEGDSKGLLVNQDSDQCIEIWNLVFIQYNAEADGSYRDLPATHVDTGMGFERACSIYQGTKAFTDFSKRPSNYATDVFTPMFQKIEEMCGRTYVDIYPDSVDVDKSTLSMEMKEAVAFRVIADHIRTLSFSIADGIMPGNNGRNYVLRRILRRAVNYGRTLGFLGDKCFLPELVDTLVAEFGTVFPELGERRETIRKTLQTEEESFNRTLTRGLQRFEKELVKTQQTLSGEFAFELYDTFGFPVDLTEILCEQNKLVLDKAKFDALMLQQQERARAAQKSTIVRALDISTEEITEFVGFDSDFAETTISAIHSDEENLFVITKQSPFYTEMGGQVGDLGSLSIGSTTTPVHSVMKIGGAIAHVLPLLEVEAIRSDLVVGTTVSLCIDGPRRREIEAHHTATHLLHWALHEVVSSDASQQGSSVMPDRLRFDFNSGALTSEQVSALELKVQEAIYAGTTVSWVEVPHVDVKKRKDVMQFFGDKYGELVRVVQIGGEEAELNGYAMELCGGTHTHNTADIGTFKIKSEGAIAAGVRRIEAVCGPSAEAYIEERCAVLGKELSEAQLKLDSTNQKLSALGEGELSTDVRVGEGTRDITELEKALDQLKYMVIEAAKTLKRAETSQSAAIAEELLATAMDEGSHWKLASGHLVGMVEGPANLLQELLNCCKKKQFKGAVFFIVDDGELLHLGVSCGEDAKSAGLMAGKLIQELAPIAGGKGGGKPDQARGAAALRDKIDELYTSAQARLS